MSLKPGSLHPPSPEPGPAASRLALPASFLEEAGAAAVEAGRDLSPQVMLNLSIRKFKRLSKLRGMGSLKNIPFTTDPQELAFGFTGFRSMEYCWKLAGH